MADRYPDYDVLAKWDSPSFNDKTREILHARMKLLPRSKHLGEARVATLARLVQRVIPQPECRAPANTLALVIAKIDADARSWDVPNLWVCDGSVFPTVGGVNPSLTIQALACRTADRIGALAKRGEL